jgi:hypothetical protein
MPPLKRLYLNNLFKNFKGSCFKAKEEFNNNKPLLKDLKNALENTLKDCKDSF